MTTRSTPEQAATPVLGGTSKTGRGIVRQLGSRELSARMGSRPGRPRFDWLDQSTWAPALAEDGHTGRLYEVAGTRLLTFAEAAAGIGRAAGRDLRYRPIPLDEFTAGLEQQGVAPAVVGLPRYLFGEVLDGRNAAVTDGIRRALGREPRDFADYAQDAAANGVWEAAS